MRKYLVLALLALAVVGAGFALGSIEKPVPARADCGGSSC